MHKKMFLLPAISTQNALNQLAFFNRQFLINYSRCVVFYLKVALTQFNLCTFHIRL